MAIVGRNLLAIAVGALTFGSMYAKVRPGTDEVEGLLFVVCLVLALPLLVLLLLFGLSFYDALGGST